MSPLKDNSGKTRIALPGVKQLVHMRSTPSTQAVARRLAEEGAPAWTLVLADRQSRGKGRMDRRWSSPKGGLYFSLILRPEVAPAALADMSGRTARACARALENIPGLDVFIKLPNDILARPLGSADWPRKVCGILLEASGDTRKVDWVVLGIGVNVNNRLPRALNEAAAISPLAGRRISPSRVLAALMRELRAALA